MNILSIDLGTKAGFAICQSEGAVVSGIIELNYNKRIEGAGMRFLRFKQWLTEINNSFDIDMVSFEEVRRHAGTQAAHVYGGMVAILTSWCEHHEIPYTSYPVGTIKKFATGKGNASKQDMIENVVNWGFEPVDDNEADALAILHLSMNEFYVENNKESIN